MNSILKIVSKGAMVVTASLLATTAALSQDAPALEDIEDAGERDRVAALIEQAQEEGALEWVGVMIDPEHAEYIFENFREYYGLEDIRTEYTYVGTAELVTRVEQLLSAGRNNFDIVWSVAWAWYNDLLERGEVMKYDSPYYAEYTLSNDAGMSKEGYWVSDAYSFTPVYNPQAVEKAGISDFNPKSWADFLDPALKGLVSMGNVLQSTSYAPVAIGIRKTMGDQWFYDLAENVSPTLFVKSAQGRDWAASGEFPISLMSHAKNAAMLLDRGVDVRLIYPEEGSVMLPFAPIILDKSPHPAAAKLFIDFVRSAKGAQTVMDSGAYLFFGRPGVVSPFPEILPRWEDVSVAPMDWDVDGTQEAIAEIRELFRESGLGF